MNKRILLVEDEPLLALVLERALQWRLTERYDIDTSSHASAALEQLRESPADLVVTDLQLPGMNGLELVRQVRRLNPRTHIMLITAYGSSAVQAEIGEMQATFLAKPFTLRQFIATVLKILEAA